MPSRLEKKQKSLMGDKSEHVSSGVEREVEEVRSGKECCWRRRTLGLVIESSG